MTAPVSIPSSTTVDRTGASAFADYAKRHPVVKPMSDDEIELHKQNALKMGARSEERRVGKECRL